MQEVAWQRLLAGTFGNTALATSAVVSAFMGGLALGAWGVRDRVGRWRRILGVYAVAEGIIAAWAGASPWAIAASERFFVTVADLAGNSLPIYSLLRLGLAFAAMLPATMAMGATFPVMVEAWVRASGNAAIRGAGPGSLYAANLAGACAGVLVGLLLIPALGVRGSLWAAGTVNLIVSVIAWVLSKMAGGRQERFSPESPGNSDEPLPGGVTIRERRLIGWGLAAVAGAVSLGAEVVWTRVLFLAFGSTVYAFGTVLLATLVGLALAGWLASRVRMGWLGLGFMLCAGGAAILAASRLVELLPIGFLWWYQTAGGQFAGMWAGELAMAILLLMPGSLLIGMVYPTVIRVGMKSSGAAGPVAAKATAWNTVGGLVGAAGTSLALIPGVGSEASLRLLAVAAVAAGVVGLACGFLGRAPAMQTAAVCLGVLTAALGSALWFPRWNEAMVSSGVFRDAAAYARGGTPGDWWRNITSFRLVYARDGAAAHVSVRQLRSGSRVLAVNGKPDASTTPYDMVTQSHLAHIPLLLNSAAERVMVIGMGAGVTAGAVLTHPVRQVTVVEIEPAVLEAAEWFEDVNRRFWEDARVDLVFEDARTHLALTRRRYDVIISEPSNPWVSGSAALFSRDFYVQTRRVLAPGGILAQWIPAYRMRWEDIRTILRTVASVFPTASLWGLARGDILVVAAAAGADLSPGPSLAGMWHAASPALRGVLAEAGLSGPGEFLGARLAGEGRLREIAGTGPIHSDGRPVLEYEAPKAVLDEGLIRRNREYLGALWEDPSPFFSGFSVLERRRALLAMGQRLMGRGWARPAARIFTRLLAEVPGEPKAWLGLSQSRYLLGEKAAARRALIRARSIRMDAGGGL